MVTWTAAGTFSTGGNVRTIDVGTGGTLAWNGQNIATAAGTGFIKNGSGTWNIGGQGNAYAGGFTLNAGTVLVGSVNALGAGALTINGGTIAPDSGTSRDFSSKFTSLTIGGNLQLGDVVNFSSGTGSLTFGAASLGGTVRTITIGGTGSYTFNGALSGTSGGGLTLDSNSTGTLVLSGANAYTGPTTISSGNMTLSGASGSLALSSSAISLNGGTFTIDNTGASSNNNSRIVDTQAIELSGGNLVYKGSNQSSTNSSETVGAITQGGGNDSITLTFGGTNTATVIAASFAHIAGNAATLINGISLGKDSASTASVSRLILTAAPTLVGTSDALTTGINSSTKDTKIVPFLVGEATTATGGLGTTSGTANTFLTYNATTGLRPLNPTDEFTANAFTAGTNVRLTAGTTASSSVAINSLVVVSSASNAVSLTNGSSLTVTSGAVLFTGGGTITTSSGGTLAFGSTEGMISTNNGVTATIAAGITGSGGLTKSGSGTLTLSGANTYSGGTTVGGGTLTLSGSDNRLKSTGAITVSGGTLALGATNQSAGAVALSSGSITGTGTLTGTSYAVSGGTLSAKLGGSNAMTVSGSATLSGANTGWSGNTTINSGTLTLGDDAALGANSTTATINSGGTLDLGSHTIANAVVLNSGTLSASSGGSFGGALSGGGSLTGPLTLVSGASYALAMSGGALTNSLIVTSGLLTIDSGATLSLAALNTSSFTTGANHSWTVIDHGSGSITGTALTLTGTSGTFASLGSFSTDLTNGNLNLNWNAISAVPEPSTYAALLGALALAGAAWRRARASRPRPAARLG